MSQPSTTQPTATRILLRDDFATDIARGRVIGTGERRGIDVEKVLSVDHGALRIEPLAQPGWARSGIAYGPFQRTPGLAFAIVVNNGHNLSQSYELASWIRQTGRWLKGSGTHSMHVRFLRWLGHHPRIPLARKLKLWRASRKGRVGYQHIRDNLALGFFSQAVPADPRISGNHIVIHASEAFDNGELWARIGDGHASTCQSLQNLPICYIIVLRDRGAIYYAASLPGAHGVGPYPSMRPVAIDPFHEDPEVYAAAYQSVLGEIGFTMDTRIYGVTVAELPELASGSAHGSDILLGTGRLGETPATVGGAWRGAGFERTPDGARPWAPEALAYLEPPASSGLIHAMIRAGDAGRPTGLAFRVRDPNNLWACVADSNGCHVRVKESGRWIDIASGTASLRSDAPNSIQIVDHGSEFAITINGAPAVKRIIDGRLADARGVGLFAVAPGNPSLTTDFEAHPREVPIPADLDMGAPWNEQGDTVAFRDEFAGPRAELSGRTVSGTTWRRDVGRGAFEVTGDNSLRVVADIGVPSPGRTIYTVEWHDPTFADLDVEMTPPGTERGQTHRGRGGVVFWQDPRNYFMINLWLHDNLETASISTFFYINGFDDLYDAIWTCTGPNRTTWGKPFRMRSAFDGNDFTVRIDDEPVLHRALFDVYPRAQRLNITRVGLLANWEWGTDTGTIFRDFVARKRGGESHRR